MGPIELILSFILLYPLIHWKDYIYLSKEYYCFVSFRDYSGILWVLCTAYGIPLLFMSFIYLRITIFIHQQSASQVIVIRRRHERDFLIIRRIVINMCILLALGIPSVILLTMLLITGKEHPLLYRISLFSASLSMAALSISTIFLTPLLKSIVL